MFRLAGPAFCALVLISAALGFQRPFREYPGEEYTNFPLPPDFREQTEWVMGRLMYPSPSGGFRDRGRDWREGYTRWTNDYPRADRHFAAAIRRLTRLQVRSVEQPINLEDGDDIYNWPWAFTVQAGPWELTTGQAAKLREYLLRGGFLMCTDLWGDRDLATFTASVRRIFPDRPFVEIPDNDPIFQSPYDLHNRTRISGMWAIRTGIPYMNGGVAPHWRGIYDDRGRVMLVVEVNSATSDSWEWADDPNYPEAWAGQGIRIGINYVIYSMTH
jgi:hypothetical protein